MKKIVLLSAMLLTLGAFINTSLFAQDYKIAETGQMSCYDEDGNAIDFPVVGDSLYGQDAQYTGFEIALVDNGDGTVTDEVTGLMWQQFPVSDTYTYYEAIEYCENLELGGYDDWRLPNLKELFSIGNFNSGWPYLDQDFFSLANPGVSKDEQYWSDVHYVGVTVEGGNDAAFGVNHVTGHIKAYPANSGGPIGGKQVRAVRGNAYGDNDFTDNGDGTITDNATELMWTQDDSGEGIDWKHALAYAEGSEFADYDDWRLPNVKELHSIVDYSYSPSAEDPDAVGPAINPIFNCTPIINEAGDDDYAYYWTSTSALFQADNPMYYAWYVAFGRAVNGDGVDFHGAGGIRFDTKYEGGPLGEGGERYYNYVRLVRNITSTGVEESYFENDNFNIYPNPTSDQINIAGNSEITELYIFDLTGKTVLEYTPNSTFCTLDLSSLNNGLYILRANCKNNTAIAKTIIKQ